MSPDQTPVPAVYADRVQAGKLLAQRLQDFAGKDAIILALPRGGVPVGAEIARALTLPLDVALVRKIGAPGQPELALGAVSDRAGMQLVVNRDIADILGVSDAVIDRLARAQLPELERRQDRYRAGRPPPVLKGKTVIVVDDGVATGATARAALQIIRGQAPASIVLALPVAPPEAVKLLEREADVVVCLQAPRNFIAVGAYFADFDQVGDDEVRKILETFNDAPDEAGGKT